MHVHESFEVLDGLDFELERGVFVGDEYRARMHLEGGHRPHVGDALFDRLVEGERLLGSGDYDHHLEGEQVITERQMTTLARLVGVHDGADADGERAGRNFGYIVAEKASVGLDGVFGEGLDASSRHQTAAGLVERNVSVGADSCRSERR